MENIVKNMANEVTRNCQAQNVTVDPEFVIYLIELLLLNPKYGKLFSKTINRKNLQYFVEECVGMLTCDDNSMNTLKMQHIMQTTYAKLEVLIDKHLESIANCLRPLVNEILDEDPPEDGSENTKLFRKISIYIVLASGLGNPGVITTLKEGMAALESVFSLEDLKLFMTLPRAEKMEQVHELLEIVSGVRLFNRDCKKGGDGIPDLPFNLVDAGKGCLASLSHSLITVMQRVNMLTTAIEDCVYIDEETGNACIEVMPNIDLTIDDYKLIFEMLAFNRQYEVIIRRLLSDVETMLDNAMIYVDRVKSVLEELHSAVKYKAAVPVVAVFPLFARLWRVWRAMQNVMFLVSTVNRLMTNLAALQDQMKIPYHLLDKMLKGKQVITDQDRMGAKVSMEERLSLGALRNYMADSESFDVLKPKHVQFLGFCALCLSVGALVPSNVKIGVIKSQGQRYGFCNSKMATRFSGNPERYVNEVLNYARNNPSLINLLNIIDEVYKVKEVDALVIKHVPKIQVLDKDIQTEVHPVETYIEQHYSWDLWEWKRRACQWANIVNCRTHGTQTNYSHMRSEIQCQTVEPRDKCLQTKKDCGINTISNNYFFWGLRGQLGYGQHLMDLRDDKQAEKLGAEEAKVCKWPCLSEEEARTPRMLSRYSFDLGPQGSQMSRFWSFGTINRRRSSE